MTATTTTTRSRASPRPGATRAGPTRAAWRPCSRCRAASSSRSIRRRGLGGRAGPTSLVPTPPPRPPRRRRRPRPRPRSRSRRARRPRARAALLLLLLLLLLPPRMPPSPSSSRRWRCPNLLQTRGGLCGGGGGCGRVGEPCVFFAGGRRCAGFFFGGEAGRLACLLGPWRDEAPKAGGAGASGAVDFGRRRQGGPAATRRGNQTNADSKTSLRSFGSHLACTSSFPTLLRHAPVSGLRIV